MNGFLVAEIAISAGALWAAVILFSRSRPWRSLEGLLLYTIIAMFATVLSISSLGYFLGDYPGRTAVRYIAFTLILIPCILIPVGISTIQGRRESIEKLRRIGREFKERNADSDSQ